MNLFSFSHSEFQFLPTANSTLLLLLFQWSKSIAIQTCFFVATPILGFEQVNVRNRGIRFFKFIWKLRTDNEMAYEHRVSLRVIAEASTAWLQLLCLVSLQLQEYSIPSAENLRVKMTRPSFKLMSVVRSIPICALSFLILFLISFQIWFGRILVAVGINKLTDAMINILLTPSLGIESPR